ncbi:MULTISPECIES: ribbon-helix-helix domain-containing protein [Pseudomonas syringae group]|nr:MULTISPECIES: type II toxin-antitoxin system ParD family antitoxin [Pseudomonas syringae group]PYD08654.1 type II toxin-antitoxin system ParD family antitoxin [Pseudomonas syringae pv. pisi]PYD25675.1 type II toxin-antitoxin system ParD family antitoxin [Pseudomonas syringae pv. pisi]PYD26461.1 type II toxin-antitoxin system ParD family antitoxin [Pseudomonas syringae pv. pisi]
METVRMTDQKGALINAQTDVDAYTSDSEHIRDLIRRKQARSADIEAIRLALIEGESSGAPRPFNVDEFKRRMLKANG